MSAIEVAGLEFGYGEGPVLQRLDLSLGGGDILAVIGPSGCGKTTLLRLLAGFDRPEAGTITIGETMMAGGARFVPANQRRIGLVPQEGALFPHLTLAENVGFALGRRDPSRPARIAELVAMIGLTGLEGRYPRELSGGQQQRVALARALAPRPELVLLDEPFASLDPATRIAVRRSVHEVLRQEKATAVLVTHDREEALSMADQVAVMLTGGIVQTGEPHEVYDAPIDARVASLLGEATLLEVQEHLGDRVRCALGTLPCVPSAPDVGGALQVLIRPEQVRLGDQGEPAVVVQTDFVGTSTRVVAELADGTRVIASLVDARPAVGDQVRLGVSRPVHLVSG